MVEQERDRYRIIWQCLVLSFYITTTAMKGNYYVKEKET